MSYPYTTLGPPCLTREGSSGGHGMGRGALCPDCSDHAESLLLALPRDVHLLSAAIAERPSAQEGPGAPNKPHSTPPINLLIDALRSQIVYTASVWEEVVRDHAHLSPRRTGAMRAGASIVSSVRILAPRVDLLVALPHLDGYFDGVESGLVRRDGMGGLRRLLDLHHLAMRAVGHTAVVIRLPGACPRCDDGTLRRDAGSDTVYCARCAGRWPYGDYQRWVQLVIDEAA